MKLKVTDWITTGNISPLNWGDSFEKLGKHFDGSTNVIKKLKQLDYPYIELDFVEFYFDSPNFERLVEIVIKNVSVQKGMKTKFIDPDWLSGDLTFGTICNKLNSIKIDWTIERGPHFNTPNIRTSSGVLLAFYPDPDLDDDDQAELFKIYLKKQ